VLDRPVSVGPVQVLVIAYADGSFDAGVLDQLRRLRAGDAVRLIDLLFVAKDPQGEVLEIEEVDLAAEEFAACGDLVRALFGADAGEPDHPPVSRDGAWFLADEIPAGVTAAVAVLEHRWALPLRDTIESAAGHDLADRWIHREDLPPIEANFG
jgi:hypothetical protein